MSDQAILPDWKWGTAEGSRELDRLLDRRMTFREKLEWLEEAETLALRLRESRTKEIDPGQCGADSPSRP
jgi:hypothetical protein